jgi:hypothetical protein
MPRHQESQQVPKMTADSGLDIGRRVKAKRIAEAVRKLGGTPDDARQFSDDEWLMADSLSRAKVCDRCHGTKVYFGQWCTSCKGSGRVCPTPDHVPSKETQAYVIEYLSRPEAPATEEFPARDEDVPQ